MFLSLVALIVVSIVLALKKTETVEVKEDSSFWVVSGQAAAGSFNNIWYSANGVDWTAGTGLPFGNDATSGGNFVHYSSEVDKWVSVGGGLNWQNIWSSSDGMTWTSQASTDPGQTYGVSVVYANNMWVGLFGKIIFTNFGESATALYYSNDGISWYPSLNPVYDTYITCDTGKVHYANNRWVVVSNSQTVGGPIYYSDDGKTWIQASGSPFGNTGVGYDVYYANDYWVAVGDGQTSGQNIWYSTSAENGSNWTVAPGNAFGAGFADRVYYADSVWVAVGGGDSINIWRNTSTPNTSWVSVLGSPFGSQSGNDVYYGGEGATARWVAVGKGDTAAGNIVFSADQGANWSASTSGNPFGTGTGFSVRFGDSKWVATGNNGIWTSSDGENWTEQSPTIFYTEAITSIGSIIYEDSTKTWVSSIKFTTVGGILYSNDGTNFYQAKTNIPNYLDADFFTILTGPINATYGDNKWVFLPVGNTSPSSVQQQKAFYSYDAINWINSSSPCSVNLDPDTPGNCRVVKYGNGKWITMGEDLLYSGVYTDTNLLSWATAYTNDVNNVVGGEIYNQNTYDLLYAKNTWLAGTTLGIFSSLDGIQWSLVGQGSINIEVYTLGYYNGLWLAAGSGDTVSNILYSPEPLNPGTWVESMGSPFDSGGQVNHIHYANNKWVAVGMHASTAQNIWYSFDGITWQASSGNPFGAGGSGNKVYYGNNRWVAVGDGIGTAKNIWYSETGETWQEVESTPFTSSGVGNDVFFNNNFWVACGEDGIGSENIYYSTDGQNWTAGNGSPFSTGGKGLSIAVKTITP